MLHKHFCRLCRVVERDINVYLTFFYINVYLTFLSALERRASRFAPVLAHAASSSARFLAWSTTRHRQPLVKMFSGMYCKGRSPRYFSKALKKCIASWDVTIHRLVPVRANCANYEQEKNWFVLLWTSPDTPIANWCSQTQCPSPDFAYDHRASWLHGSDVLAQVFSSPEHPLSIYQPGAYEYVKRRKEQIFTDSHSFPLLF